MKNYLAMFTVLMVALGMTGVAVAHLTSSVQIQGTARMGDFIVGWRNIIDNDDSDNHMAPPKQVAKNIWTLSGPHTSVKHTPPVTVYDTLSVEIDNAYPEYWAWGLVNLKNAGTIPAVVVEMNMNPGSGLEISENWYDLNDDLIGWQLDNAATGEPVMDVYVFHNYFGIQYMWWSNLGEQIDPCTDLPTYVYIDLYEPGAEQCHTYSFSIDVLAVQWDKAPEWGYGSEID